MVYYCIIKSSISFLEINHYPSVHPFLGINKAFISIVNLIYFAGY